MTYLQCMKQIYQTCMKKAQLKKYQTASRNNELII